MNFQDTAPQNISAGSVLGTAGSLAFAYCAVMLVFAIAFSRAI
ncbi:hypothetical protein [Acinetobacter tianfuensis]|nr:hypothetical protein [Acinetobacter tianfuensis]